MRLFSTVVTTIILSISLTAVAQTGRITKAKGGKAVVDFGSTAVKEGQQVTISNGDDLSMDSGAGKGGERGRQHGLSYRFLFSNASTSPGSGKNNTMDIEAEYSYNMGIWEVGGIFDMGTGDNGTVKTNNLQFGGFGRYNFTENKKGKSLIPYAGGGLTIDSLDAGGTKLSGMTMFAMGGVNWFPWAQIFAVDGGLKFASSSYDVSGTKVTTTTLALFAGWKVYFQ